VSEITVGSRFESRPLHAIVIHKDSVIVAIERGKKVIIARGNTVIEPGDRVVAASLLDTAGDLPAVFCAERAVK
jgi:Trk K+ transport system NAD-binding subunit